MAESRGCHLAIDLGAESGRAILGHLREGKITFETVHRFPTLGTAIGARLHWNVISIFEEIIKGIAAGRRLAIESHGSGIQSVGVDTWGVDFALMDRNGDLLGFPHHYRDSRTDGIFESAFSIVSRSEIYNHTGIQMLQFNTLFQLHAMRRAGSPSLDAADRLLMMPDLLHYWLTGVSAQEFTDATTTQCYNPTTRDWAWPLIDAFNLPRRLFGEISRPGAILGGLTRDIGVRTGCGAVPVALPASHDTGSAVVAVPASGRDWAYISSGTWALIGVETEQAVINQKALDYNFTNEGGAFGRNRLLTNVMGLWLLQQVRKAWEEAGMGLSYPEIIAAAGRAAPFKALINPDDHAFFNPANMPEAIGKFCRSKGIPAPDGVGETARCIVESLALTYRTKIDQLEDLIGSRIGVIHIVGGGSQNELLSQATASSLGRRVLAGPAEATALGNMLVQAHAMGDVGGLEEIRGVVRTSTEITEYHPERTSDWDEVYERFRRIVGIR